jgi:predicted GNAT superfamily acetyltransferase
VESREATGSWPGCQAGAVAEMTAPDFHARHCAAHSDFERCVELERVTWRESIVVPAALFVVAVETEGQVLGAFAGADPSGDTSAATPGEMIGFTLALVGAHTNESGGGNSVTRGTAHEVFFHSHMTAVLPAWQNRGVGRALKLAQRADALSRGIRLIEWTFDPLELRNAHFNLRRLGAIARRYIPNCYGITDSPLDAGMPTDRLFAEWHLDSPRVARAVSGETLGTAPGIGERGPASAAASASSGNAASSSESRVRIRVPANIGELRSSDRVAAAREQSRIRAEFERWFSLDYAAVDFERNAGAVSYILEPRSPEARVKSASPAGYSGSLR